MRHSRRNLLLLSSCQALMMSSNSLIIASGALIGYALAEDKFLATLPIAVQHFATMLTSFPASLLMARIGRKTSFLLAGGIGALGAVAATWGIVTGQFWVFCGASIAFGIFSGFGQYYRFAAVEVVETDYKSRAIGYVMAGGVIAAFVGPNLANLAQDWITGVRFAGSYAALIVLYGLSALAICFTTLPKSDLSRFATHGRPLIELALQGRFVVAVLCAALGYGVMSLVMTATPLAMSQYSFPFGDTALVIQWHVLGMFAPSFFTGHLINRYGCVNIMLLGGLAAAGCVAINLAGQSILHFWAALVLLGIAWNFLYIGATTLLTECYRPGEKARAQGLNDMIVFSTVTLAALSAGALQHNFGWTAVNLGVTPAILLILVSLVWLKSTDRRLDLSPQ